MFTASAQNLLGVLCSSSIVRAISHKVMLFLSTTPFRGGVYGLENWCSRPKSWQKVSKREFLNSEPLSLWIARMASSCLSFLNLKTISNKTKHLPLILEKEHLRIPRVVVHHNNDVPLPTHKSHTSWANKVHMEQLA
jgi:hypothetical protein